MKVFVTRRSFIPVCRGAVLQHAVSHQRAASYNTNSSSSDGDLRHVMRLLPQPVTVVTSAMVCSYYLHSLLLLLAAITTVEKFIRTLERLYFEAKQFII